ncbi:MAG: glycosyltransferase family 9 protein [Chthoniobacterales bacterium]
MHEPLRILIVRRDNIGDLLCTTPLLHGLRKKYPEAFIAVLASSYNEEVLRGNLDVDKIFIFPKRYEKKSATYFFTKLWKRWMLVREIRKYCFDYIILANGGWRYARRLGGKQMIGFREKNQPDHHQPDFVVPLEYEGKEDHEVSKMARLGAVLGVTEAMGPLHLFPDQEEMCRQRKRLFKLGWDPSLPTVAFHISSRQPHQRWPKESFVALAQELIQKTKMQLFLFWSPGENNNRMHPGDDEKANWILNQLEGLSIFPCPTKNLRELIAGISFVDQIICSDGGAMHVAAALQKPILCFFGASNVKEWHPWHVPYQILQPKSKCVADVSVEKVVQMMEI